MTFQLMLSALPTKKATRDDHGVGRDGRHEPEERERHDRERAVCGRDRDAVRARSTKNEPTSEPAASGGEEQSEARRRQPHRPGSDRVEREARRTSPSMPGWRCRHRRRACAAAGGEPGSARPRRCRRAGWMRGDRARRAEPADQQRERDRGQPVPDGRRGQRAGERRRRRGVRRSVVRRTGWRSARPRTGGCSPATARAGATTLGTIDCAAVSCSVSPIPRAKATT